MLILLYHHILPFLIESYKSCVPSRNSYGKSLVHFGVFNRGAKGLGAYGVYLNKEATKANKGANKPDKGIYSLLPCQGRAGNSKVKRRAACLFAKVCARMGADDRR